MNAEQAADSDAVDLVSLTAGIVSAYLANNRTPPSAVPGAIASVHAALSSLGSTGQPKAQPPVPPVPIRKTVTPDAIISLEDGKPYKTLGRHLRSRGLTPARYRERWGLPADYPMSAPNYSTKRSELARASGLGAMRRKADTKAAELDPVVAAVARKHRGRPPKAQG